MFLQVMISHFHSHLLYIQNMKDVSSITCKQKATVVFIFKLTIIKMKLTFFWYLLCAWGCVLKLVLFVFKIILCSLVNLIYTSFPYGMGDVKQDPPPNPSLNDSLTFPSFLVAEWIEYSSIANTVTWQFKQFYMWINKY